MSGVALRHELLLQLKCPVAMVVNIIKTQFFFKVNQIMGEVE